MIVQPDIELASYLTNKITVGLAGGGTQKVKVYSDWERPTNELPDDFLVVFINGDIGGVGMAADFARGGIILNFYCKMNDDGSVKKKRVTKILSQLYENLPNGLKTENYIFEYIPNRFVTPTTPNQTSGYSVTSLNFNWHTINNFNKS